MNFSKFGNGIGIFITKEVFVFDTSSSSTYGADRLYLRLLAASRDVWRQLDAFIATRLFVPWTPLLVLWMVNWKVVHPKPEILGSAALVLAARLLAEGTFPNSALFRLIFCGIPIIGGSLLFANAIHNQLETAAWVFYLVAGAGTMLVAISDWRGRI
jgi:hypothetical protein